MRALGLALMLALAVGGLRFAIGVSHGLTGEYFSDLDRSGRPRFSTLDADLSTATIERHWADSTPPIFSVRWRGYLVIGRSAFYRFATTSDDGSRLYVDNELVVDNGGRHSPLMQSGRKWLERGPHFLLLEYEQQDGSYSFEWSWAVDDGPASGVPAWRLSPGRISYPRAAWSRAIDWLWWIAIVTLIAATIAAAAHAAAIVAPLVSRRPRLASFVLFVGLTVVHTWPLATDPAHLSRNDNRDTILNEWTLAWVAHQAPRAVFERARGRPGGMFDANIFYPEKNTLAYSESMPVQSAMAAPLLWAGASPVLAYNLVLMAGFALTGWAMCLVLVRWTGDWMAAVAGGTVMGFNAATLTRLPHLQAQHVEFLPFVLFALDRLLAKPRIRSALSLAGWFVLQALTSFYLMVFTFFAIVAAVVARPEDWAGRRAGRTAASLAIAVVVATAALVPFLLPYWRVSHDQGFTRSLDEVAGFAATSQDYLTTPARIPRMLGVRWTSANGFYPGFAAFLLAVVAIASGIALREPRARMCLAVGVCGVVLSFGPRIPGYSVLYDAFPPLHGIRAVSRFGYLALVAVSVLAAYGVAEIRSQMRGRAAAAVSAALLVIVAAEPLAAPITYTHFDAIPPIYRRVANEVDAVVAELPLASPRLIFVNAPAMLNATTHWQPLLNGYSGFIPSSYRDHYDALESFPEPSSVAALRRIGVTHVFVRPEALGPVRAIALERVGGLRRIAEEDGIALYAVCRGQC